MSGINTGKLITAGLLAALVFFAVDSATFGFILRGEYDANTVRLGLDPATMMTPAAIAGWVAQEIVFGLLVVWLYAAIRPRFGPGPKTAIYAGLVPFIAIFMIMMGMWQGGIMTQSLFVKGAAFGLLSTLGGSLAGGWAYKEA